MESSDQNSSDEVAGLSIDDVIALERRIVALEKIVSDFSITGTGISGNIEDGYTYNNPDEQTS